MLRRARAGNGTPPVVSPYPFRGMVVSSPTKPRKTTAMPRETVAAATGG